MPCVGTSGTEYIDIVVRKHFNNNYAKALEAFVHDPINKWCPTWIRRNYDVQSTDQANDQDALAVKRKYVFQDSESESEKREPIQDKSGNNEDLDPESEKSR